jgi:hypothetical protein
MSKPLRTLITVPLVAVVAIPAMLLMLPLALGLVIADGYARRKAVRSFACLDCGSVLGLESLALAAGERRGRTPEAEPATVDAVCRKCGIRYFFNRGTKGFERMPPLAPPA